MGSYMTVPKILATKGKKRLVMVTAYDATFARLVDAAGVDMVLVGDSLGNVIQGHQNTIPVELEDVAYHCRCVSRGLLGPLLVADMPFMSYQASTEKAIENAGYLLKTGRAHSVKIEGGRSFCHLVSKMVDIGIPVMGHLGLTPQSYHLMGGYKLQGRSLAAQDKLLDDAMALQEAGAYALVLEGIPGLLAQRVTESLNIPTIGIGAGPYCDGQVLVLYDLLGLDNGFNPRFLKKYANLSEMVSQALELYSQEVRQGVFPSEEHWSKD